MLKRLINYGNYFIPSKLRQDSHTYYRAFAFVTLNLFLIFSVLATDVINRLFSHENDPNLLLAVLILATLLFITRKYGNLIFSGNFIAALTFLIMGTSVPSTGGLYSDNLLWLIIAPMMALLFANKRSGFFWLVVLLLFTIHQFLVVEDNITIKDKLNAQNSYYFTSYLLLFIFIFGIIMIFEKGQALIIRLLKEQKEKYKIQKKELSKKNKELKIAEDKLRQSNSELENFAFIAAHDLREPLRMIGMYTQLTQKKLNGSLDKSTLEYMSHVNDGVFRMQNLLNDLLNYARLGKDTKANRPVDLNNTLYSVMYNLLANVKDTNASIIANQLPTIVANSSEMNQLFQNLMANAIKFRKKDTAPIIEINAFEKDECYEFTFKDNGIGIKEEHKERVFNIFEKLHAKNQYEGSGIGLATCRKIVQNLGGHIWLTSDEGVGTTFHFTLCKKQVLELEDSIENESLEHQNNLELV